MRAEDSWIHHSVTAALVASLVLVLALIAYTVAGEFSRRQTEELVLRDYGTMAASELRRVATIALHEAVEEAITSALARARPATAACPGCQNPAGAPIAPMMMMQPGIPDLPPELLLAVGSAASERSPFASRARIAFRYDLSSGELLVAGAADESLRRRLVALASTTAGPMADPHRVAVDAGAESTIAMALQVFRDTTGGRVVAYGLIADDGAIGAVFEQVLASRVIVPSAILRPPTTSDQMRVSVSTAEGVELWHNAALDQQSGLGSDTVPLHVGGLVIRAQAGPALADVLRIGRPSAFHLPALAAMFLLSIALTILAVVQLRRSREIAELRNRFIANVSHELRTPLTQISMFAEMLALGRTRDEAERTRYAEIIWREVTRLSTLASTVLHFARSRDGSGGVALEARELRAEIAGIVEFFSLVAAGAGATIELEASDDVWARVDPSLFRQIVLNLLDNAVKFGPRGQTVQVSVRREGTWARIAIADEGPGIGDRDRERVFDPYVRLDRAGAPKVAGAGIGLSVVRDLVRAIGGSVAFEDAAYGAAVVVRLPAITAPPSTSSSHELASTVPEDGQ